jgi:hypothetical protein
MALADVEAILIKATYTTNTREAAWVFSLCSFARHLWKIVNVYLLHFVLCVRLVRVLNIKMLQEFHTRYLWPPCCLLPSTACFCTRTRPHPVTLLIGSGYFEPNLYLYKYPNILNPSCYSYLPTYEDGTDRVWAYKIQTPWNYPEESIQHSEHGKSSKSRRISKC